MSRDNIESERPGFIPQQYLLKSYVTLSKSLNLLTIPFPHLQNTDLIATIKNTNGVIKVQDETQYKFLFYFPSFINFPYAFFFACLFWYGLFVFSYIIATLKLSHESIL